MEYLQVFASSLDQEKHWYVLKTPFLKSSKFSQRVLFNHFPEEIRKIPAFHLTTKDGTNLPSVGWFHKNYKVKSDLEVNVVTSFGIYAGLLTCNQKNALESSKEFDFFRALLNSFCLNDVRAKTADMRAKSEVARQIPSTPLKDFTLSNVAESLKEQINQRDKHIAKLQNSLEICSDQIQALEAKLRDEFGAHTTELLPTLRCQSLKEISADNHLSSSAKKKKITAKARNLFRELQDVSEKHRESLASILGHLACDDDHEARDLLGEIANMVAEEQGVKKAAKIILSEDVFKTFIQSMTVPDWVLLYFKISARLPDGAWQMLLNLTRLGDTGVSFY